jgi:transposase
MLDVVPVRWRVIRHVRPKYSCRSCEKIVQAPAPVEAIARGKATFATLAHVVVAKFYQFQSLRFAFSLPES